MGTCLVTNLKESVSDNTLLHIGEFIINVDSNNVFAIFLGSSSSGSSSIEVKPPGYITNSTGTSNLGLLKTVGNVSETIYLSAGKYDILVKNKYGLRILQVNSTSVNIETPKVFFQDLLGITNLESFVNAGYGNEPKANIEIFNESNFPVLRELRVSQKDLYVDWHKYEGDIAKLSNTIKVLSCAGDNIYGDISCLASHTGMTFCSLNHSSKINGNIGALSNMTSLTNLYLADTKVSGNISSLSGLTSLNILTLDNTLATGDTSSLTNLDDLTTFTYTNTAITGNWPLT